MNKLALHSYIYQSASTSFMHNRPTDALIVALRLHLIFANINP